VKDALDKWGRWEPSPDTGIVLSPEDKVMIGPLEGCVECYRKILVGGVPFQPATPTCNKHAIIIPRQGDVDRQFAIGRIDNIYAHHGPLAWTEGPSLFFRVTWYKTPGRMGPGLQPIYEVVDQPQVVSGLRGRGQGANRGTAQAITICYCDDIKVPVVSSHAASSFGSSLVPCQSVPPIPGVVVLPHPLNDDLQVVLHRDYRFPRAAGFPLLGRV
jgi:hypothetical protein